MVIADVSALRTLPKRETMEGWAEAIQHGLILDADLFRTLWIDTSDPHSISPR